MVQGSEQQLEKKKKFLVIGGGWGGWGAAKALCESGLNAEVTLIDALPDPTGITPYVSKTGKPVEAGTRGFWKDYPNINKLCADLGISEYDVFTPFTNSSFYSPDGLEATAPVFSTAKLPKLPDNIPFLNQISEQAFPQLPSPLGQVVATSALFERIPIPDRASMVGLLIATVDCLGGDEELYAKYDRMTAHELFLRFGLSKRLVDDFLKPTLLVGLFKPPEELSAAVVMELLYFYALAHQTSFDVRWIRRGTVSSSLLAPLAERLQELGGITVQSASVESLEQKEGRFQIEAKGKGLLGTPGETVSETFDGVVLAVGAKGLRAVMGGSSALAKRCPELARAAGLGSIDVMSTRIWLDRYVATTAPANVWASFPQLQGAGGTFFMLDQLQDEAELWPGEEPRGSVVSCDFYNASALLLRSDEEIIRLIEEP